MKRLIWSTTAALVLAAPSMAIASDGYVIDNVSLRAGPDVDYPLISTIPAGARISIQGCTDGWEWCDVTSYGDRGWVAGDFIQYDYQNQRVYVPEYGARIGIPIISFVINSYWDSNYRTRSFYRERTRWYSRPMPHRAPPPRPIHRSPPGSASNSPPPRVMPLPRPIAGPPVHQVGKPMPSPSHKTPARPRANRPALPRPIASPRPTLRPLPAQAHPAPMKAAGNNQGNQPQPRDNGHDAPANRPAAGMRQDKPQQDKPDPKPKKTEDAQQQH